MSEQDHTIGIRSLNAKPLLPPFKAKCSCGWESEGEYGTAIGAHNAGADHARDNTKLPESYGPMIPRATVIRKPFDHIADRRGGYRDRT